MVLFILILLFIYVHSTNYLCPTKIEVEFFKEKQKLFYAYAMNDENGDIYFEFWGEADNIRYFIGFSNSTGQSIKIKNDKEIYEIDSQKSSNYHDSIIVRIDGKLNFFSMNVNNTNFLNIEDDSFGSDLTRDILEKYSPDLEYSSRNSIIKLKNKNYLFSIVAKIPFGFFSSHHANFIIFKFNSAKIDGFKTIYNKNRAVSYSNSTECFETENLYIQCLFTPREPPNIFTIFVYSQRLTELQNNLEFGYIQLSTFTKIFHLKQEIGVYIFFDGYDSDNKGYILPKIFLEKLVKYGYSSYKLVDLFNFDCDTSSTYDRHYIVPNENGLYSLDSCLFCSDAIKINESKFVVIFTIKNTFNLLICLFDLYNDDSSLSLRYFLLELSSININISVNLRLFNFQGYFGLVFYDSNSEYPGFIFFNQQYFKSIEIKLFTDSPDAHEFQLKDVYTVYYGIEKIQIIKYLSSNETGVIIKSYIQNSQIENNTILDLNDGLIFEKDSEDVFPGEYILEFALIKYIDESDETQMLLDKSVQLLYKIECHEKCKSCTQKDTIDFFYCVKCIDFPDNINNGCCDTYKYINDEGESFCLTSCNDELFHYKISEDDKYCLSNCTYNSEELYQDESENICYKDCSEATNSHNNLYIKTCVKNCPSDYISINNICVLKELINNSTYNNNDATTNLVLNEGTSNHFTNSETINVVENEKTTNYIIQDDTSNLGIIDQSTTQINNSITTNIIVNEQTTNLIGDDITTNFVVKDQTTNLIGDDITTNFVVNDQTTNLIGDDITTNSFVKEQTTNYIYDDDSTNLIINKNSTNLINNDISTNLLMNEETSNYIANYDITNSVKIEQTAILDNNNTITNLITTEKITNYIINDSITNISKSDECFDSKIISENKNSMDNCFIDIDLLINKYLINNNSIEISKPENCSTIYYIYSSKTDLKTLNSINSNLTFINIEQCVAKLIDENILPEDAELLILGKQSPSDSVYSAINEFDYKIHFDNGTKLSEFEELSLCDDTKIEMSTPINDYLSEVTIEQAKKLSEQGYDIFNLSSSFYYDICTSAYINGSDLSLSVRLNEIMPDNISFCLGGCTYKDVDLDNNKFICSCGWEIGNTSDSSGNNYIENVEENFFIYIRDLINYEIATCFKLIYDLNNYRKNFGFYLGVFILFIILFLFFFYYLFGRKEVKLSFLKSESIRINKNIININQNNTKKNINIPKNEKVKRKSAVFNNSKVLLDESKNERSRKSFHQRRSAKNLNLTKIKKQAKNPLYNINTNEINKKKNSIISSKRIQFNNFRLSNKGLKSISQKDIIIENLNKDNSENRNIINDKSTGTADIANYNDLSYGQAIKKDERSVILMFISYFKEKLEIIQLTFYPKKFSHKSLTFSLYIFELLLDLTINSLLFSDAVISQKYYNNGQLLFFTSNILSISSNIIVSIITYLVGKLINYYEILQAARIETNNAEDFHKIFIKLSFVINLLIGFFYFFLFSLGICCTYYLFIFCAIYKKLQKELFINYILSSLWSLGFTVLICIIVTIFRKIAIIKRYRMFYILSKFIDEKF